MEKNENCAVVVTFNRKDLLINTIKSLLDQELLNTIYIVDNASTDGTEVLLYENKVINSSVEISYNKKFIHVNNLNSKKIVYCRLPINSGGAGGFFEGQQLAYNGGFKWIWLMDDDGYPSKNCLSKLLDEANQNNLLVINPVVLNCDNHDILAFGFDNCKTYDDSLLISDNNGLIYNSANPFNGTLLNRKVIETIGYIKKEMFIWGDETEYLLRLEKNNIQYATTTKCKFFHPPNKTTFKSFMFGKLLVPTKPKVLEMNFYRNIAYNIENYGVGSHFKVILKYFLYYICTKNVSDFSMFLKYYFDGKNNSYLLPCLLVDSNQKNNRDK